jgi:hypothetical protein
MVILQKPAALNDLSVPTVLVPVPTSQRMACGAHHRLRHVPIDVLLQHGKDVALVGGDHIAAQQTQP